MPQPQLLAPTARRAAPVPRPVAAPAADGHLPYERYVLANGLTVVLHAYAAAPLVQVEMSYHVGSGHEAPGRSGLAHFCEHLLFEGSRHVAAGEHQRLIQAAGGTANALTDRDSTRYYQAAPAPALELLLWLEADRLGWVREALTPAAVETQRAIILQERAQTCDARPYGRAPEHVSQALYPAGHPYAGVPIGTAADIAALTLADIDAFLARWYVPANATLTIGGDFDPAQVRRWVARYFGCLPGPGAPPQPAPAAPRPVPAPGRRVVVAEAVSLPLVQLAFATVPRHHPAALALDALAEIIGQGKNSLLFEHLVRTQQAAQVAATHTTGALGGELTISILARPGVPLATLEQAAWAAVREAARPEALPEALTRFANRREAALLSQLDSLAERVRQLAAHERQLGQPDYLPTYLAQLRALRPAAVQQAHATYLLDQPAVLLHVLPLASASPAAPGPPARGAGVQPSLANLASAPDLKGIIAENSLPKAVAHRVAPVPGPARPVVVPAFWRDCLPNGVQLIGSTGAAVPALTLVLGLPGGRQLEQGVAAPAGPAGLAALTAALLNEGSRRYAGPAFTAALNRLGSTVHVSAGPDQTTLYVHTMSRHAGPTLALLEERLLHPRFDPADFARLRQQTLDGLAHQNTQAPALADRLLAQCLHDPASGLGQPLAGTLASVGALRLADVQAFYARAYAPGGAVLAAAGSLGLAQLDPYLGFLHGWAGPPAGAGAPAQLAAPAARLPAGQLYFLHRAGAAQAELRLGCLAPAYDATGPHYEATLLAFWLGGPATSRLAQSLRQRHGYAYSVRAGLAGAGGPAPFTVQAAVRPEAAGAALAAIAEELARLPAGPEADEWARLQAGLRQLDARRYETNQQRAFWLHHLARYALPADYVRSQHARLAALDPAAVGALATRHLPPGRLQTVVVGDGPRVLPGLRAQGYEVVEMALTAAGELAPA